MTAYSRRLISGIRWFLMILVCCLCVQQAIAQKQPAIDGRADNTSTWEYAVVFNSAVKTYLSFFNSAIPDTQLTATVEGSLNITSHAPGQTKTHVCCRFISVSRLRLPLPASVVKEVNDCLLSGFCFTQHDNGIIDSIFFPDMPSEAAEHIVIQLVEAFQYYKPQQGSGVEPHQMLSLSDGKVVAAWREQARGNGSRIISLDSLTAVQPVPARVVELLPQHTDYKTAMQFHLDALQVVPERVEGYIERESRISHRAASKMVNRYLFIRGKKIKGGYFCEGSKYSRPLFFPERLAIFQQGQLAERADKIRPAELEEALLHLTDSAGDWQQARIADDVKAVLSGDGPSLAVIERIFNGSDPRSVRFKLIRGALISSPAPAAQEIVGRLISRYHLQDPSLLRYIVPSAGLIKTPARDIQHQLEAIVLDSRITAERKGSVCLALGNMAGQLIETDTGRADSLVSRLTMWLKQTDDPVLLLSVLGNAGARSSLPVILPYLEDSVAATSRAAYYALRFIADTVVDRLYIASLHKGKIADNKHAAVILEASFYRPYQEGLGLLMKEIIERGGRELQLLYLQLICHHSYRETRLLELVRTMAVADTEAGKAAKEFLQRAGR